MGVLFCTQAIMIAKRPFDWDASDAADEAIYAAHEGDDRPNALFDEDGNRLKLDASDPCQQNLRDEWFEHYAANGGEVEDPDKPPNDPPDNPVKPCEDDELRLVMIAEEYSYTLSSDVSKTITVHGDPMKARRQYVNGLIRGNPIDRIDHGISLHLRAMVMWKSGKGSGLAGHTVRFQLEPLPGNRENLPENLRHGIVTGTEYSTTTQNDGWTMSQKLSLSTYGGDRFRVRVTLESGGTGEIISGVFTVWRYVDFNVHTMDFADGTTRNETLLSPGVASTFARQYIEFRGPGTDAHPSYKGIITDSEYQQYIDDNGLPNPGQNEITFIFSDFVVNKPKRGKETITRSRLLPKDGEFIINTILIPGKVESAAWKQLGGSWNSLSKDRVALAPTKNPSQSYVRVDTDGLAGFDPSRRVRIKVVLRVFKELGGFQVPAGCFIATRQARGPVSVSHLEGICIHEAGHAFGVAAQTTPEGQPNPYWMDDYGHCSNGDKSCIMYKSSAGASDFCEVCADMLRARDLVHLPNTGGDPF